MAVLPHCRGGGHAQQQPQSVGRAQPAGAARIATATTAATEANVMAEPAEEEEGAACVEEDDSRGQVASIVKLEGAVGVEEDTRAQVALIVKLEGAAGFEEDTGAQVATVVKLEGGTAGVEEEETRARLIVTLEGAAGVKEDIRDQVAPIVKLEQPLLKLDATAVTTGEESEDLHPSMSINPKLSGFDKEGDQSKELLTGPEETSDETEDEPELYSCKLRVRELSDERDYLEKQLNATKLQLREIRSVNKKLLEENQKLQRNVEPKIESRSVMKRVAYCHNLFLCGNEVGAIRLVDYLADSGFDLLYTYKIPGASPDHLAWQFDEISKMSPFCKTIFLGLTEFVYRLHRIGLTLGGKFSLKDFYWTLDRRVKLRSHQKQYLARRRNSRMKLDYLKLHGIMQKLLEDRKVDIPADLAYFLDLMESDPVKYQVLLRYNFCLMDDISKREYTITLFTQMEEMDKEDEDKFGSKVRTKYRTAMISRYMYIPVDWSTRVCSNKFVKQVYEAMKTQGGNNTFIYFMRHCMVHLPQKSFDEEKRTHYMDSNVVDMVEVHAPAVFSQFQRAMHELRRLGYPHLIRIMKA